MHRVGWGCKNEPQSMFMFSAHAGKDYNCKQFVNYYKNIVSVIAIIQVLTSSVLFHILNIRKREGRQSRQKICVRG